MSSDSPGPDDQNRDTTPLPPPWGIGPDAPPPAPPTPSLWSTEPAPPAPAAPGAYPAASAGSYPPASPGGYPAPGYPGATYPAPAFPVPGGYPAPGAVPAYPAYGAPPGYGYAPPPKTNVMAILSLVMSAAALLTGITAILGVIFGHIGLSQIKRTGEQGRGLAIAGLVIGYVLIGLAVVGIVLLVVFGAFIVNVAETESNDQAVRTSLRTAATYQEEFLVDNGRYAGSVTDLNGLGFVPSSGVTVTVVTASESAYCMEARKDASQLHITDAGLAASGGCPSAGGV